MLFTHTAIFAIMAVVMGAIQSHAGPLIPKADKGLVAIRTEHAGTGSQTSFSLSKTACGDNDITCYTSGSHQASTDSCWFLLNSLQASSGDSAPKSPRSICVSQSGNQCCTSWADQVNGPLFFRDLIPAVQKLLTTCPAPGGRMSGTSKDTDLGGTCTTQCLSDRPNGCAE